MHHMNPPSNPLAWVFLSRRRSDKTHDANYIDSIKLPPSDSFQFMAIYLNGRFLAGGNKLTLAITDRPFVVPPCLGSAFTGIQHLLLKDSVLSLTGS